MDEVTYREIFVAVQELRSAAQLLGYETAEPPRRDVFTGKLMIKLPGQPTLAERYNEVDAAQRRVMDLIHGALKS